MTATGLLEPGVFGIFRPVLLLPEGIFQALDPAQWSAVLAHEMCHVRAARQFDGFDSHGRAGDLLVSSAGVVDRCAAA